MRQSNANYFFFKEKKKAKRKKKKNMNFIFKYFLMGKHLTIITATQPIALRTVDICSIG